jgi:hypothetical protein
LAKLSWRTTFEGEVGASSVFILEEGFFSSQERGFPGVINLLELRLGKGALGEEVSLWGIVECGVEIKGLDPGTAYTGFGLEIGDSKIPDPQAVEREFVILSLVDTVVGELKAGTGGCGDLPIVIFPPKFSLLLPGLQMVEKLPAGLETTAEGE